MPITAQERLDLITLINGVFDAAPTVRVLSNLTNLVEAGNSVDQIATMLTNNTNFEGMYPSALLSTEFASQFVARLLGSEATESTTARAEALVLSFLNDGFSRTEAIWKVTKLLRDTTDAEFAAASAQLNNQADVSLAFALDTQYVELMTLEQLQSVIANVTSDAATATAAKEAIANGQAVTGVNTGDVFTLTTGVDTFAGTAGNDIFNASDLQVNQQNIQAFGTLDSLNGGNGTDTFNLYDQNNAINVAGSNVSNIEVVNVAGAQAVTVNTTNWSGVEDLNLTQAGGNVSLTAAATTDVSVANAAATTAVTGGKTVTVSQDLSGSVSDGDATDNETITEVSVANAQNVVITGTNSVSNAVDSSSNNANDTDGGIVVTGTVGTVDITTTARNVNATAGDNAQALDTMDAITVTGGTAINVTQNANSVSGNAATNIDNAADVITQGDVTVTGGNTTTTVNVKQDDQVAAVAAQAAAGTNQTQVVTFSALTAGQSATVNGLTFTATKALTAAEVAQAFANLTNGDRQDDGGPVVNGTYTGQNATLAYTSGAANGATVTYTAASQAANTAALTVSGTGVSVAAGVSGVAAQAAVTGVAGVTNGLVTIDDNATKSITTVTVDGYAAGASLGTNSSLDALTSLTLKNSGTTNAANVDTLSTGALTLTLDDVDTNVNLDASGNATLTGLTINTEGTASTGSVIAAAATTVTINAGANLTLGTNSDLSAATTFDVNGSAAVNLTNAGIANSTVLQSIDASDNTGGVTVSLGANNAVAFTGGAGSDSLTLASTGIATGDSIAMGAGDDTVYLQNVANATNIAAGVTVSGGEGEDTLRLDASNAATLSGSNAFEGKIDGFEKLQLDAVQANDGALTVNLDNMDDISYVISANTPTTTGGVTETATVQFQALTNGQSVTLAGITIAANGADLTAAEVEAAVVAGQTTGNATYTGSLTGWTVADTGTSTDGQVLFTSTTANSDVTDLSATVNNVSAPAVPSVNTTDGVAAVAASTETATVTFGSMVDGDVVTVNGLTLTATARTEVANVQFGNVVTAGQDATIIINGVTVTLADGQNYTAAEIASAFATSTGTAAGGSVNGGTITVSGSYGLYSAASATSDSVNFTSLIAKSDVTDLTVGGNASGTTFVNVTTQGNNGQLTAAQVAEAFDGDATANPAAAVLTGSNDAGFTAGAITSGNTVTFTSTAANQDVTDISVTGASVSTTDGTAGTAGSAESAVVTFGSLTAGQTVTVAGTTLTATAAMTAAQVATYFSNQTITGYTTSALNGAALTFTSSAQTPTNETDIAVTTGTVATSQAPTVTPSQGSAPANATDTLTLTNMANNGTLELNAAGNGVTVTLTDATGTADAFNIVLDDSQNANGYAAGTVTTTGVETINVSTDDTVQGTTGTDTTNASYTLTLSDATTTTVNVSGAGDINLQGVGAAVKTVNASAAEGAFTFQATTANMTVTGGAGNDTISVTGNADKAILNGGAGNDTFNIAGGADQVTIDGGAGNDTFVFNGVASTDSLYTVINNIGSGDTVTFGMASITSFNSTAITLASGATESTQAYQDAAMAALAQNEAAWFQYGGNTYIVADLDGNTTYTDAADFTVMLTGLVDLSTASFNTTTDTLEIA